MRNGRTLLVSRLGCGGLKQRRAHHDTGVAAEAGVPGDHVFDVPRRRVTELATPLDTKYWAYGAYPLGRRPQTAKASPPPNK